MGAPGALLSTRSCVELTAKPVQPYCCGIEKERRGGGGKAKKKKKKGKRKKEKAAWPV